jgi:hypothetical protein
VKIIGVDERDLDPDAQDCDDDMEDLKVEGVTPAPCVDCDQPGKMEQNEFNPKQLLQRLCAGGKCPHMQDVPQYTKSFEFPPVRKGHLAPDISSI